MVSAGTARDLSGQKSRPGRRQLPTLIILGVILGALAGSGYALVVKPDYTRLNLLQRWVVQRVVAKWERRLSVLPEETRALVAYDYLLGELNPIEKMVAQRILTINPRELGFKGPFHSLEKPGNLVLIASRTYKLDGKEKSTGSQYCPEASYNDYLKMMAQMRQDLEKELFIESGYRSPGQQAYLFFFYLVRNHRYCLYQTARWVALPGYSEHNAPVHNAVDLINAEGINGDTPGQTPETFEALPEYQWLIKHAHKYNFHLSYPRGNPWGISFEPWHWHWEKQPSSN